MRKKQISFKKEQNELWKQIMFKKKWKKVEYYHKLYLLQENIINLNKKIEIEILNLNNLLNFRKMNLNK